jgi:two-component system, NtrC family, sensor histidine kinase HydH
MILPNAWITLLACVGELLLLFLVLRRGARTPLSAPLIGLAITVFGWNFGALAHAVSGASIWRWFDVTFSPMTSAFALHFVLAFTGRRRQLGALRIASYVFFGGLAAAGPVAFFFPAAQAFYDSHVWAALHLVAASVTLVIDLVLLGLHHAASHDPAERARTRLLLTAIATGALLALTELMADLGFAVPRLGAVGVLVGNSLVVMVALGVRVFDRALTVLDGVFALSLAALGVAAHVAAFQLLGTDPALVVVLVLLLTFMSMAVFRQVALGLRTQREQLENLAQLGRLSAQLAHDLKNPLAALRGAAQLLETELSRGGRLDEQRQFLSLIVDQADRLRRVVDEYQRLGRLELARQVADLNGIVRDAVKLQPFASSSPVNVEELLAAPLPPCEVDVELVTNALQNLLRNAAQAMPSGGQIRVETREEGAGDIRYVVLAVADTGVGMDPRTVERAFEEGFTTRRDGTGLGLAFVRRVAKAHGGRVVLHTREGRGTRVEMWLPRSDSDEARRRG